MAAFASTFAAVPAAESGWQQSLLDDCSKQGGISSIGTSWSKQLDADRGGSSYLSWHSHEGVLSASGRIEPGMRQMGPGTAGLLLPFALDRSTYDISHWDGIEITVARSGAPLLLRIHTDEIGNGDYFAVEIPASEELVTYRFPFQQLGQVMSPQQPWQGQRATGIELITWSFAPREFDWDLDSVSFYQN